MINHQENINRFEKKWTLQNVDLTSFLIAIYRSPFLFKESFKPRKINSIYFDDKNFLSITENIDGNFFKKKYRLRWYGNRNKIFAPQFEIKSKKGLTTYKKIIPVKTQKNYDFNDEGIKKICGLIYKKFNIKKNLYPILSTHYVRHYFISANLKIRATFDHELASSHIYGYKNFFFKKKLVNNVLEIKYNSKDDDYVKKNIKNISARMSKSSKYVYSAFEKANNFTI